MKPNPNNFCGGNFTEWLEVNLLPACDGRCSWCVERKGWHPKEVADTGTLIEAILNTGKSKIILLGGEPTLHKDLGVIVSELVKEGREVYITTHGGHLSREFVETKLQGVKAVNISIHSFVLEDNLKITGIDLRGSNFPEALMALHKIGATYRFNCNCIRGYIDSKEQILKYIMWAKSLKADSVRFAELKFENESFVDLAELFDHEYGLNDDPYLHGCNTDTEILGMKVNFRQMCGLQTSLRVKPEKPELCRERCVVYYDGKAYDGWQVFSPEEVENIQRELISKKLAELKSGKISKEEALKYFTGE